jgi:stage III sporulation protein AD
MAAIAQIVGAGLIAALLLSLVRSAQPAFGVALSLAAAAALFLFLLPDLVQVVRLLQGYALRGGVSPSLLGVVFKVLGIAYLTEFGAGICRDAGESSLAARVELGGKVLIFLLAIPVLNAVLSLVLRLTP